MGMAPGAQSLASGLRVLELRRALCVAATGVRPWAVMGCAQRRVWDLGGQELQIRIRCFVETETCFMSCHQKRKQDVLQPRSGIFTVPGHLPPSGCSLLPAGFLPALTWGLTKGRGRGEVGEGSVPMGKLRLSKACLAREVWASAHGGRVPVAATLLGPAYKLWCPLPSCPGRGHSWVPAGCSWGPGRTGQGGRR